MTSRQAQRVWGQLRSSTRAAPATDRGGDGGAQPSSALAPALDIAGSGVLPELIDLAGGGDRVITMADFEGAQKYGVHFSNGFADGHGFHALGEVGALVEAGRFWLPVERTFPLADIAEAHRISEGGGVRGRLVLVVGGLRSNEDLPPTHVSV